MSNYHINIFFTEAVSGRRSLRPADKDAYEVAALAPDEDGGADITYSCGAEYAHCFGSGAARPPDKKRFNVETCSSRSAAWSFPLQFFDITLAFARDWSIASITMPKRSIRSCLER
jgi:hypothetical protein